MVDTVRTLSAMQALLGDNTSGDISAQDIRDLLVSTKGGHGYYPDNATIATPISITSGVRAQFTSDGLGVEASVDLPARNGGHSGDELWDTVANEVLLDGLIIGDKLVLRVTFEITPSANNMELDLFLRAFNSAGGFEFEQDHALAEIKLASAHSETVIMSVFIGSNILDGSLQLEFLTSKNADVTVFGIDIMVVR
jgi:hypothetical protein